MDARAREGVKNMPFSHYFNVPKVTRGSYPTQARDQGQRQSHHASSPGGPGALGTCGCVVSLRSFNGGIHCSGRSEALAVRAIVATKIRPKDIIESDKFQIFDFEMI